MRLADLLLGNDLFQANSKLRDPIERVNFDISPSPVMDKATFSESIDNQMSVTSSDQIVESGVTFVNSDTAMPSSDHIVISGVTLVNSEIVVPSSDPIEIGAVTRSQSKHKSEVGDGDGGPVTLSDEMNRMLRDMDITKFKEMQESDSSLHALRMKSKQNDSRDCISNDLLYERSKKVDDPGLLLMPKKLRNEVLYLAHDRLISSYMGVSKTIRRIRQHFSVPGLEQAVRMCVLSCTQYQ